MSYPKERGKAVTDLSVLVVDDQDFMRAVMHEVLTELGFGRIDMVKDGQAAVALLRQQKTDLVITDLAMKPMNGLELLRRIRAGMTHAPRDLPVIILSGHSERHVVGTALLLDVSGFVVKPVRPAELVEKMEQAVSNPVSVGAAAAYRKIDTDIDSITRQQSADASSGVRQATHTGGYREFLVEQRSARQHAGPAPDAGPAQRRSLKSRLLWWRN